MAVLHRSPLCPSRQVCLLESRCQCNRPRVKHAPARGQKDRDHLSSFWHLARASAQPSQASANPYDRARNRQIDTAGQTRTLTCHPEVVRIQKPSRDREGARLHGTNQETPPNHKPPLSSVRVFDSRFQLVARRGLTNRLLT